MSSSEIISRIEKLNDDEEILDFVHERLKELEEESEEAVIGQGYTDTYSGFISNKIHYKSTACIGKEKKAPPDLIFDDESVYVDLIKRIKTAPNHEAALADVYPVFCTVRDYFLKSDPTHWDDTDRAIVYYQAFSSGEKSVSIKQFKQCNLAFCSEFAGLTHNLFKFLGFDSELVVGARSVEGGMDVHAYNLIYPRGYEGESCLLLDVSNNIEVLDSGVSYAFPFVKKLTSEEQSLLKLGTPVDLDGLVDLQALVSYYQSYGGLTPAAAVTGETSFTYALGNGIIEKVNESRSRSSFY